MSDETPRRGPSRSPADERRAEGMVVRREVLGDEHVDRAVAATTGFTADFQDFITRYAWGEVWTRQGLDRRTRSCVTLALLTALGCVDELGMHVRAALRNGVTREEIAEVLLHTAVYAGVPRANAAYARAQRVLRGVDADKELPAPICRQICRLGRRLRSHGDDDGSGVHGYA